MVMNVLMAVFGPLAGPECRRGSRARGWVIVVRSLVAGVPACSSSCASSGRGGSASS